MQKKEFKYRQMKYVVVWMLVLGAPFVLFVPDNRWHSILYRKHSDNDIYYICFMETSEYTSWSAKNGLFLERKRDNCD